MRTRLGLAMAHGVADRFLDNAISGLFVPPLKRGLQADIAVEKDFRIAAGPKGDQIADRRFQAEFQLGHRAQLPQDIASHGAGYG